MWFLLQLVGGVGQLDPAAGGVAFWGHVGGLAIGAGTFWLFQRAERVRVEWWTGR
jgi:membrane associated rhomboid family serine protease